ncbi:hypothetical protein [Anaerosalibacter bizertensis]|uniref:hypothetical protein n=1 Tax=Anaerosalibacter bizertensis TaxID=932217 RepID=UPI0035154090
MLQDDNTLLDGLMKYRVEDGEFIHSKVYDWENPTSKLDESNFIDSETVTMSIDCDTVWISYLLN